MFALNRTTSERKDSKQEKREKKEKLNCVTIFRGKVYEKGNQM